MNGSITVHLRFEHERLAVHNCIYGYTASDDLPLSEIVRHVDERASAIVDVDFRIARYLELGHSYLSLVLTPVEYNGVNCRACRGAGIGTAHVSQHGASHTNTGSCLLRSTQEYRRCQYVPQSTGGAMFDMKGPRPYGQAARHAQHKSVHGATGCTAGSIIQCTEVIGCSTGRQWCHYSATV